MQNSILPEMFYGANRDIFQKAEYLREHMTLAELTLWERLNKNQLNYRLNYFIHYYYDHKKDANHYFECFIYLFGRNSSEYKTNCGSFVGKVGFDDHV